MGLIGYIKHELCCDSPFVESLTNDTNDRLCLLAVATAFDGSESQ